MSSQKKSFNQWCDCNLVAKGEVPERARERRLAEFGDFVLDVLEQREGVGQDEPLSDMQCICILAEIVGQAHEGDLLDSKGMRVL